MDGYLAKNIEANRLPILLFLADGDTIIDNEGVLALLRESPGELEVLTYEDQPHSIQFDATDELVADTAAWLERQMTPSTP